MNFLSFFNKDSGASPGKLPVKVDIHSHLIPGIDDGVQTVEESLDILKALSGLGYEKVITTPHTMPGTYPNTPETILGGLEKMKAAISGAGISIQLEAASEYYLDEVFLEMIEQDRPVLTFGKNYLLFETGFMTEPPFLKEATFQMSIKGYRPVYAHPERYLYLINEDKIVEEMLDRNVYFQLNLVALSGAYSRQVRKFAEKLIDMQAVHFVGTDCHHIGHLEMIKKAIQTKYFKKLMKLDLLNNTLI